MKLYTEEQVRQMLFDLGDVLFNNCQNGIDEGEPELYFDNIIVNETPIELPSDEEIEKIAQWVIDNRYAKSELNKVSDFEMYHHIIKLMKEQILNQNK